MKHFFLLFLSVCIVLCNSFSGSAEMAGADAEDFLKSIQNPTYPQEDVLRLPEDASMASTYEWSLSVESRVQIDTIELEQKRLILRSLPDANGYRTLSVDISFPSITGLDDGALEHSVNLKLLDSELKLYSDNLTINNFRKRTIEPLQHFYLNAKYTVLDCNDQMISLLFDGSYSVDRSQVYFSEYVVTIDLQTGAYKSICDACSVDVLQSNILAGNYEVLEGTYSPGGWRKGDDGVEESLVSAFSKFLDQEYVKSLHAYNSNRWENGSSYQSVEVDGVPYKYEEYDRYTAENYGQDKESYYIRFPYSDSLDGYVLLKIPIGIP